MCGCQWWPVTKLDCSAHRGVHSDGLIIGPIKPGSVSDVTRVSVLNIEHQPPVLGRCSVLHRNYNSGQMCGGLDIRLGQLRTPAPSLVLISSHFRMF